MTVSPDAPQDDVLTMMARPGHALHYTVQIPKDHPPGLYRYHTHAHGESYQQVLHGMSGALVIEGMESYFPPVSGLPERVLVVRGRSVQKDKQSGELKKRVELSSYDCGAEKESPEEILTVNGSIRPETGIGPGERQFWRIVNASADRYLDLAAEEKAPPRFVVVFTEDKNGFYINGEKFTTDAAPMVRAKVGGYQHWKIINATKELHPMHIHQVHFLAYAERSSLSARRISDAPMVSDLPLFLW